MKKAISLMIAAMAMMVMMSACTPAGAPLSMVGEWKVTGGAIYDSMFSFMPSGYSAELYLKVDNDDTVTMKSIVSYQGNTNESGWGEFGKIKKCSCNEFYFEDSDEPVKYEITGNAMTWKHDDDTVGTFEKK